MVNRVFSFGEAEVNLLSPALSFDGVDGQNIRKVVSLANVGISGTAPRTLEFWAKVISLLSAGIGGNPGMVVAGWGGVATSTSFIATIYPASNPHWYLWGQGDDMDTGVVPDLLWHHHALTFDGTTARWYIDDVEVKNQAMPTWNTSDGPLQCASFGSFWDGHVIIDEVRLWSGVARTQAQIQDNMKRRLAGNESGLVGYWRMDERRGTRTKDAGPKANHGTIVGAAWSYRDVPVGYASAYSLDRTPAGLEDGTVAYFTDRLRVESPWVDSEVEAFFDEVAPVGAFVRWTNEDGRLASVAVTGATLLRSARRPDGGVESFEFEFEARSLVNP